MDTNLTNDTMTAITFDDEKLYETRWKRGHYWHMANLAFILSVFLKDCSSGSIGMHNLTGDGTNYSIE